MQAPAVSHEYWEKTRGLAQIAMGTNDIRAEELSFEDRMMMLLDVEPEESMREIEKKKQADDEGKDSLAFDSGSNTKDVFFHTGWGEEGAAITVDLYQDQLHRPEVSDDGLEALNEWVEREYPYIPVKSVDFEDKLALLLDSAQEYFNELNCRLKPANLQ